MKLRAHLFRMWYWLGGLRRPCRWYGCSRDWPEMERCWSCGRHLPLDSDQ